MKKLMIAACVVACAAMAQAATITWTSGTLKLAEDEDGTIGSLTPAAASGNVAVNSYLWIWAVDKDVATGTATASNFATKAGGTGTAFTAWQTQSVPEPTSAMLILLGVAGMALKRKRA